MQFDPPRVTGASILSLIYHLMPTACKFTAEVYLGQKDHHQAPSLERGWWLRKTPVGFCFGDSIEPSTSSPRGKTTAGASSPLEPLVPAEVSVVVPQGSV